MSPAHVSAIDVGTSKICAAIAEINEEARALSLLGWSEVPSQGIQQGAVVDVAAARGAITAAIAGAETAARRVMKGALVSIAGAHVRTLVSPATIQTNRAHQISQADMQQALYQASQIRLKDSHQILHTMAGDWMVDEQFRVRRPQGMHATSLGLEARVLTGSSTAIANLIQCVSSKKMAGAGTVLASLASAHAVLSADEMDMGVALIDIGAGTTDLAVFQHGHLRFAGSLNVGGNDFTRDLASLLHCPEAVAEEIKLSHGGAIASVEGQRAEVRARVFGDQREVAFSTRFLRQILATRADQLWDGMDALLRRSGFRQSLPAGLVLTGGASQLHQLGESCRARFKLPVRMARVPYTIPIENLASEAHAPAYTTLAGLLLWGGQPNPQFQPVPRPREETVSPAWRTAMRNLLSAFMPG